MSVRSMFSVLPKLEGVEKPRFSARAEVSLEEGLAKTYRWILQQVAKN